MSQFDPEQFMLEPSEDAFYDLKKDELISLAKHLKLEVKKAMRKYQIQDIVIKHLVSLKIFEEAVLETYEAFDSEEKSLQFQLELKKLEMQERLEREEKRTTRKTGKRSRGKVINRVIQLESCHSCASSEKKHADSIAAELFLRKTAGVQQRSSQQNYSTVEKECLALVLAMQHFEVYMSSSSSPVVVYIVITIPLFFITN